MTACRANAETTRSRLWGANGNASASVAGHEAGTAGAQLRIGLGGDQRADLGTAGERARECVARRAEVDRDIEPAQHHGDPLGHFLGGAIEQKGLGPAGDGAAAAGAQERAIEDERG